jgi:hypothetical protein
MNEWDFHLGLTTGLHHITNDMVMRRSASAIAAVLNLNLTTILAHPLPRVLSTIIWNSGLGMVANGFTPVVVRQHGAWMNS